MSNIVQRARTYAKMVHATQVRRYTQEPYFNHLEEVASIVQQYPHDQAMVAAAYLHDTLEDTDTTSKDLHELFGPVIANLVWWLTDQSRRSDGNRATRKAIDRRHISQAPAQAQTIKLADLISNTHSIVQHDPHFAKVYLAEKRMLLDVLQLGDRDLHARAKDLIP